jgi:glycerol uptake facilitator-like aquaporin
VMTETQEEEGGTATAAAAAAIVAQPRRGAAGRAARALHGGLAIGLVYLAGVLCASKAGTGSGGVFNPALGVATAFVSNNGLSNVWVYVAGPAAGAAMGAALFALLHLDRSIGIDEQAPKDAGTYAFVDSYQNSQDTQLAASGARYPYMI